MKNKITVSISLIALLLFSANISKAAFPIKKASTKTVVATNSENQISATSTFTSANELNSIKSEVAVKKHTFLTKMTSKLSHGGGVSQAAYIILAIFWLGWLAMGINDNFEGFDWVLSLILYILFWLPGFLYTLIMMGKYY